MLQLLFPACTAVTHCGADRMVREQHTGVSQEVPAGPGATLSKAARSSSLKLQLGPGIDQGGRQIPSSDAAGIDVFPKRHGAVSAAIRHPKSLAFGPLPRKQNSVETGPVSHS